MLSPCGSKLTEHSERFFSAKSACYYAVGAYKQHSRGPCTHDRSQRSSNRSHHGARNALFQGPHSVCNFSKRPPSRKDLEETPPKRKRVTRPLNGHKWGSLPCTSWIALCSILCRRSSRAPQALLDYRCSGVSCSASRAREPSMVLSSAFSCVDPALVDDPEDESFSDCSSSGGKGAPLRSSRSEPIPRSVRRLA
jgi:hypothetical protein